MLQDKDKEELNIDELNNIVGGNDGEPQIMPIRCQTEGCGVVFYADVTQPIVKCPNGHVI